MATTFVVVIFLILQEISAKLVTIPQNQTVKIGESAYLRCSSDVTSCDWKIYDHDGYIYKNGRLQNGYADNDRFSIDSPSSDQFNLVIKDVQTNNEGIYVCIENSGNRQEARATLKVDDGLKDLLVKPRDTIIKAANDVTLTCSSSYSPDVFWRHLPIGELRPNDVYLGSRIGMRNGYQASGRYSVIINKDIGQCDLLIRNVRSVDAGKYSCLDLAGTGRTASAELGVIDSGPDCFTNASSDGLITKNSCKPQIDPDTFQIMCGIKYRGNIDPKMEWKNKENRIVPSSIINSPLHSRTVGFSAIASTKINQLGYECQIADLYTCKLNAVPLKILPTTTKKKKVPTATLR